MNNPVFVNSKLTGGHFAFKTARSKKPFENTLSYYAKIELFPNDVVADIGSYVGEYALYAANHGVKKVLCYEPTPATFEVLKMNRRDNMELHNVAVVGNDDEFITLHISKGIGVTNSIVKADNKASAIRVKAIRYEEAVRFANVVKIDVEGAEYLYNIIQPQLRAIILEFHPINKRPWRTWAEDIMEKIESSGYKKVYRPTFESGWNLTGCWQR